MDGLLGPQGIDSRQRLLEHVPIEEKQGRECSVLGLGGHALPHGEMGQESLRLSLVREASRQPRQKSSYRATEPQ